MDALITWVSPSSSAFSVRGTLEMISDGGDGIVWALELLSSNASQTLASGTLVPMGTYTTSLDLPDPIAMESGDALTLLINCNGGFAGDSTLVDFTVTDANAAATSTPPPPAPPCPSPSPVTPPPTRFLTIPPLPPTPPPASVTTLWPWLTTPPPTSRLPATTYPAPTQPTAPSGSATTVATAGTTLTTTGRFSLRTSSSLSTGAIIGIAAGAFVAVGLVTAGAIVVFHRKEPAPAAL